MLKLLKYHVKTTLGWVSQYFVFDLGLNFENLDQKSAKKLFFAKNAPVNNFCVIGEFIEGYPVALP